MLLGLPFKNVLPNYFGLGLFTLLSFLGGYGAGFYVELLIVLTEIVRRPIRIPFFRLPHPAIARLQTFFSFNALLLTGAYSGLAFSAWVSPYQLHPGLLVWLAILGLWPLAIFCWSVIQIHSLIQKAKQSHLDIINNQIQQLIEKPSNHNKVDIDYGVLEQAMNVQLKVQNISEWPVAFSSIITFAISTASAIVQIVFAVVNILRP